MPGRVLGSCLSSPVLAGEKVNKGEQLFVSDIAYASTYTHAGRIRERERVGPMLSEQW